MLEALQQTNDRFNRLTLSATEVTVTVRLTQTFIPNLLVLRVYCEDHKEKSLG